MKIEMFSSLLDIRQNIRYKYSEINMENNFVTERRKNIHSTDANGEDENKSFQIFWGY